MLEELCLLLWTGSDVLTESSHLIKKVTNENNGFWRQP